MSKCTLCNELSTEEYLGFPVCKNHTVDNVDEVSPAKLVAAAKKDPNSKYFKENKRKFLVLSEQPDLSELPAFDPNSEPIKTGLIEEIVEEEKVENGIKRNEDGTFAEGTAPGPGRPIETEEKKIIKKAVKVLVEEYKESLADVLPELSPVLRTEALKGNIQHIKEIHDRVMGKAEQHTDITSAGLKLDFAPIFNNAQSTPETSGDNPVS